MLTPPDSHTHGSIQGVVHGGDAGPNRQTDTHQQIFSDKKIKTPLLIILKTIIDNINSNV